MRLAPWIGTATVGMLILLVSPSRAADPPAQPAQRSGAQAERKPVPFSARGLTNHLDCRVDLFDVSGCHAFLVRPKTSPAQGPTPWVWYAPIIGNPSPNPAWMLQRWLQQGVGMAGVDVGESCGNPRGRQIYTEFFQRLTTDYQMAPRACLLPQSRGGLMLYNWAAEHPANVACIAGIYTVCDLRSYPGLKRACEAYGLSAEELEAQLAQHNPIDRLAPLAQAGVPILHLHGDEDKLVPLEQNSGELARRYTALGGPMRLIVVAGKGHQASDEFFHSQELVDFVVRHAQPDQPPPRPALPTAHTEQNLEGWTVRVDDRLLAPPHAELGARALRFLQGKLADITLVVPTDKLAKLRSFTIVLDLNHGDLRSMQYHPSANWLEKHGYSRDLARCVHITEAPKLVTARNVREQPWCILHELAHAYHDQVLGFNDPAITAAFERFKQSGHGDATLLFSGKRVRHYGLTNAREFFAEMTEAYFGSNDFFPFNRAELMTAEPEIHALMRQVWEAESSTPPRANGEPQP